MMPNFQGVADADAAISSVRSNAAIVLRRVILFMVNSPFHHFLTVIPFAGFQFFSRSIFWSKADIPTIAQSHWLKEPQHQAVRFHQGGSTAKTCSLVLCTPPFNMILK
jgi:hypothetical protein